MKKFIALIMTALTCVSLITPALATEVEEVINDAEVIIEDIPDEAPANIEEIIEETVIKEPEDVPDVEPEEIAQLAAKNTTIDLNYGTFYYDYNSIDINNFQNELYNKYNLYDLIINQGYDVNNLIMSNALEEDFIIPFNVDTFSSKQYIYYSNCGGEINFTNLNKIKQSFNQLSKDICMYIGDDFANYLHNRSDVKNSNIAYCAGDEFGKQTTYVIVIYSGNWNTPVLTIKIHYSLACIPKGSLICNDKDVLFNKTDKSESYIYNDILFYNNYYRVKAGDEINLTCLMNSGYIENDQYGSDAMGYESFNYQWYYKSPSGTKWYKVTKLEGYNSMTLIIPATYSRNNYSYKCIVTDFNNKKFTSESFKIKVDTIEYTFYDDSIINVPKNEDFEYDSYYQLYSNSNAKYVINNHCFNGDKITLHVDANYLGYKTDKGLTYQWQYKTVNGTNWKNSTLQDAQTNTLIITAKERHNGYMYRCKITAFDKSYIYTDYITLNINSKQTIKINNYMPEFMVVGINDIIELTKFDKGYFKLEIKEFNSNKWYLCSYPPTLIDEVLCDGYVLNQSINAKQIPNGATIRCTSLLNPNIYDECIICVVKDD